MLRNVDVSIVTTVRDKNQFVQSASSVLKQQFKGSFEYIVVDWGSKNQNVLSELRDCVSKGCTAASVRYIRVECDSYNRCLSNNLGFRWSLGRRILTLDCDVVIPRDYIQELWHISSDSVCLWCLGVESKDGKIRKFCGSGIMFSPLDAIYKITGYDESFRGYGEEDIDFKSRMIRAGYSIVRVTNPIWTHLTHSDQERGQAQKCARLTGGVDENKSRRVRNDNRGVVAANGDDWGTKFDKVTTRIEVL